MMPAALYVDPRGPYPALLGAERCWDEKRDARTYVGPAPVVAHPPCGPWGRLKFLSTRQDPTCGLFAIAQVRAFGGVLEHPQHSSLWKSSLPPPGDPPDAFGGFTVEVRQVAWGHCCEKPTWLYFVGVPRELVKADLKTGGGSHSPSHQRLARQNVATPLLSDRSSSHSPSARRLARLAGFTSRGA